MTTDQIVTSTALPVTRDISSLDYLYFLVGIRDDVLGQVDLLAGSGLVSLGVSLGSLGPGVFEDVLGCGPLVGVNVHTAGHQIC